MKRAFYFLGAMVGVLLALSPALFTIFGMLRAFAVLGSNGISDPRALSGAIGEVLLGTAASFFVWPLGATLAAYCIVQILKSPKIPPPLPRVSRS